MRLPIVAWHGNSPFPTQNECAIKWHVGNIIVPYENYQKHRPLLI